MKKLLMVAMALLVAFGTMCAANPEKQAMKYAKKQAKEYQKAGWKVDGVRTLEEVFFKYRLLEDQEGNAPLTGVVEGQNTTKTVNQAKQWAITNAAITYSKEAGMDLRGRIAAGVNAGAGDVAPSDDSFFEAYEALVSKEIKGELKMNFGLYRETDHGVEYRAYYIVNEDKASQARVRALENLKKENEYARMHAEKLADFVREGFELRALEGELEK